MQSNKINILKSSFLIIFTSLIFSGFIGIPFLAVGEVQAATITYDFESDTASSSPANTISENGTFTVVSGGALPGKSMRSVPCTGTTCNLRMSAFPAAANYSITWKAAGSANTYQNHFVLRAQPTPYSAVQSGTNLRAGYAFQVSANGNRLTIFEFPTTGGPLTLATSTLTASAVNTPRWYRATASSTNLTFEYSTTSATGPWTTGVTATDATFASGLTTYGDGFGATRGIAQVDDVTMEYTATSSVRADQVATPTAVAGNTTATVSFTAPASDGGSAITGYTVTSSPGGITATGVLSPITVTGLTNGTAYTFTVTATNSAGTNTPSSASNAVTPNANLTITTPKAFQVIQRDTISNTASLSITGTYIGTPTAIEASWNGGAYQTIVSNPTGGTYSGTLSNLSPGQGTLTVRFTNNPSTVATVDRVGVGDIFVAAGQSNFVGDGGTNQVYTAPGSGVLASMFDVTNNWGQLIDPVANAQGTLFPLLATYIAADQNIPVAFIPTAVGGTQISQWQPNSTSSTLYSQMASRINAAGGKVRAVLWYQGEADFIQCTSVASYTSQINTFADAVATDFPGTKTLVGQTGRSSRTPSCMDDVRKAQADAPAQNSNILNGARTYDINVADEGGDGVHFRTDGDISAFAQRWWNSVRRSVYNQSTQGFPVLNTNGLVYNKSNSTVDLTFDSDIATSTAASFTNNLSGVSGLPTSSAFTLVTTGGTPTISGVSLRPDNRTVRLTLTGVATNTLNLSYARGNNGINNAIYGKSGIPATPFYSVDALVVDVPGAPTAVTATAGNAQSTVSFTAPASNGGSAITGYTVTSSPGGITATGASSPITVTGLTNGTAYTFTVTATNAVGTGAASAASTAVTPSAPVATTFTFTGPTSGNVDAASANFTVTPNNTYTGTITLTPTGPGAAGLSPIVRTFTNSSTTQTFTITPTVAGSITLTPTNSGSLTNPSNLTYTANAVASGAPTAVTATAGNAQATVSFTAPASNGGSAITGYTVTSSPGGITATGASSPITVTGLTNGTAYTFTVTATNAVGTGAASAASTAVTPAAPVATTITISALQVGSVTNTSAVLTFATDILGSTKVNYGPSNALSLTTIEKDTTPRVTSHTETLTGLQPCTTYYYQVQSTDSYGETSTGTTQQFTTTGCTSAAQVEAQQIAAVPVASGVTVSLVNANTSVINLVVPVGYAPAPATFQVKKLNGSTYFSGNAAPSGQTPATGQIYNLKAIDDGTGAVVSTFTQPITVTINYTVSEIANLVESSLNIQRWNGSTWNTLSDCNVNTGAKTVTCLTTEFSDFGLFGTEVKTKNSSKTGGRKGGVTRTPKKVTTPPSAVATSTVATSTPLINPFGNSFVFTKDLQLGSFDKEVQKLQQFLNANKFTVATEGAGSAGKETTYFGPATEKALRAFQLAYKDAILSPLKLTQPTGKFFSSTRSKANEISTK